VDDLLGSVEALSKIGLVGALLVFVIGLRFEWWFMGGEVKRIIARSEKMEAMLFQALNIGERSTRVAESKVYEFDTERHREGIGNTDAEA
jgi:hypothetical protein